MAQKTHKTLLCTRLITPIWQNTSTTNLQNVNDIYMVIHRIWCVRLKGKFIDNLKL